MHTVSIHFPDSLGIFGDFQGLPGLLGNFWGIFEDFKDFLGLS
jgi:hypothetical protein